MDDIIYNILGDLFVVGSITGVQLSQHHQFAASRQKMYPKNGKLLNGS